MSTTRFIKVRLGHVYHCIASSLLWATLSKCLGAEETNCCSFESEMFFRAIGWWLLNYALIISGMVPLLFCQQDTSSVVYKKEFLHFDWSDHRAAGGLTCICGCNKELCSLTMGFFWTAPEPCSDFHIRTVTVLTAMLPDSYVDLAACLTYRDFSRFFKLILWY